VQQDALEVAAGACILLGDYASLLDGEFKFDAVHASPPCQRWAAGHVQNRELHPDLITPLRPLLEKTGLPYVIENVPKAPLRDAVMICGGGLGCHSGELQLHRHRIFEANFPIMGVRCSRTARNTITVVGNGTPKGMREVLRRNPRIWEKREAMGIDWMNRNELSEAIPPRYTEHIGHYLMLEVNARALA
jgi:DNA (cytosine-5)-methyltransferase 1